MTQDTSGFPPPTTRSASSDPSNEAERSSTAQRAREQAGGVGQSAQEAGQQVAHTAAEQVREVASEAGRQARDLVAEARTQARDQTATQQKRVVEGLRAVAGELRQMAEKNGGTGVATELAWRASERAQGLAGWIDRREPAAVVEEVRSFARRRPGAFLMGAVLAGVVAGRLTRGLAARPDTGGDHVPDTGGGHPGAQYAGTEYAGTPYRDPAYPRVTDQP
jgi:hypothetical protein